MNDQNVPTSRQEELRQAQTQALRHQNKVGSSTAFTQVNLANVCQAVVELNAQIQQQGIGGSRGPYYAYEQSLRLQPPKFESGVDPLKAEYWLREMEKLFDTRRLEVGLRVSFLLTCLLGRLTIGGWLLVQLQAVIKKLCGLSSSEYFQSMSPMQHRASKGE